MKHSSAHHDHYGGGNLLLDAVMAETESAIVSQLRVVRLAPGTIVQEPGRPPTSVLFPIDSVLAAVALLADGNTCEVRTVGREAVSNADLAFGAPALRQMICQIDGYAARLEVQAFRELARRAPPFAAALRATEKARTFVLEQQIACNARHSVVQRCARWLLITHDRAQRARYPLTHQFMSDMLGVRRASVSRAAEQLQASDAIRYQHGTLEILNRELLMAVACECYEEAARAFAEAVAPPAKTGAALLGR